MDVHTDLVTPVPPSEVFSWIQDLGTYPEWLDIVARAEPEPRSGATGPSGAGPSGTVPPDAVPAWSVDLRARLGPLARSKRLRMVRTRCEPPTLVVFERRETDGRSHSPWILSARITSGRVAGPDAPEAGAPATEPDGSVLHMHLHYGGRLAGKPLELVLAAEIERSRPRLLALLAGGSPPQAGTAPAQ